MDDIYRNPEGTINLFVSLSQVMPGNLLDHKRVMITGGASGIGFEIAKQCIEQKAAVIIAGSNRERLERAKRELGDKCQIITFDMRNVSAFDDVIRESSCRIGDINCLVNNAGISLHEGDFMNVKEEQWDAQLDINLKGPYFLTQAWLRYYREKKMQSGRIIMMASDTSGMGSSIPYGLSKAGIASLTRGLAKKLVLDGIRINAIAPGTTLTPMTEDFTHGEVVRTTTLGMRALFPEEIARICVFLLSDLSTCISGNVFGCSEANICFDNAFQEAETNP